MSPTTAVLATQRRLSAFKPTGRLHLGNYLGAIRPMAQSSSTDSVVMVADLHALTVEHDPARLRALTHELLATLLACGIDSATPIYLQSDLPEHAQLHYLLECATGYGEAARMIQFRQACAPANRHGKQKASDHVRLSLLTYPVLMAADILLHDADEVPVGDDQAQHVELARDVANRFNTRYGHTFTVPRPVHPTVAARVMDFGDPSGKMGKSSTVDSGVIFLLDPPDTVRHKVSRAVTDTDGVVSYDRYRKPGVSNLIEVLAALNHTTPEATAQRFSSYRELKAAVTESIVDTLEPVRRQYAELLADSAHLDAVRRNGTDSVRERAAQTVARAKEAIGLVS